MPVSELRFGLTEGGRLLAYPTSELRTVEFKDGSWVPFEGVWGIWLDSKPLTLEEAMEITSGVMPE